MIEWTVRTYTTSEKEYTKWWLTTENVHRPLAIFEVQDKYIIANDDGCASRQLAQSVPVAGPFESLDVAKAAYLLMME